jgi:hypothetical protein
LRWLFCLNIDPTFIKKTEELMAMEGLGTRNRILFGYVVEEVKQIRQTVIS